MYSSSAHDVKGQPVSQTESQPQRDVSLAGQVIEVIAEKLGKPSHTIRLEDDLLLDLGIDSLSMAEISVLVEQLGGVRLSAESLLDTRTVGDLVDILAHSPRP